MPTGCAALGMAVKNVAVLVADFYWAAGLAVELTHRSKRRLSASPGWHRCAKQWRHRIGQNQCVGGGDPRDPRRITRSPAPGFTATDPDRTAPVRPQRAESSRGTARSGRAPDPPPHCPSSCVARGKGARTGHTCRRTLAREMKKASRGRPSGMPRNACLVAIKRRSALEQGVVPKTILGCRDVRLSPEESEHTEGVARLFVHARGALGTEPEARAFHDDTPS
jgi:hypothetical protein